MLPALNQQAACMLYRNGFGPAADSTRVDVEAMTA